MAKTITVDIPLSVINSVIEELYKICDDRNCPDRVIDDDPVEPHYGNCSRPTSAECETRSVIRRLESFKLCKEAP